MRNLIREGKTHQIYSLIQTGGAEGMQTMDSSLAGLVRAGKITMATAETPLLAARRDAPPRAAASGPQLDGGCLMGAAVWTYKAVDGAGVPSKGSSRATPRTPSPQQLRAQGLKVMELTEKKSALKADLSFGRVKAAELTVMTRQLATMISSGMTLLRAFYVLEDQIENKKLRRDRRRRPRGHRVRPRLLRRARQAPEDLLAALRRDGPRR